MAFWDVEVEESPACVGADGARRVVKDVGSSVSHLVVLTIDSNEDILEAVRVDIAEAELMWTVFLIEGEELIIFGKVGYSVEVVSGLVLYTELDCVLCHRVTSLVSSEVKIFVS